MNKKINKLAWLNYSSFCARIPRLLSPDQELTSFAARASPRKKLGFAYKNFVAFALIVFLVGTTFASSFALAQTSGTYTSRSASSVSYQSHPAFQTYYGSNANTYWPILGNPETCEARSDLMLQVAPFGCQPAVVRSDLLAEQDVPVFCQVNAIRLNPLIDINQINNIRFTGQYPAEVAGTGFHPARAALRTNDVLLGSPLVNNVGYVVVVLKRQPVESKLPDSVNITLQAQVDYVAGNAYGIGRSEFLLEPTSDADWNTERLKQSFWSGRYFVRLNNVDENFAEVSIYNGNQRVISTRVNRGETSNNFYLPGMYCRVGAQIAFDDYIAAENKARIEVSNGDEVDSFDVYAGSNFLDDRCTVRTIDIASDGFTGIVRGNCRGKEFELVLQGKNQTVPESLSQLFNPQEYSVTGVRESDGAYRFDITSRSGTKQTYRIDSQNNLRGTLSGGAGEEKVLLNASGSFDANVTEDKKQFYFDIRLALIAYKSELEFSSSDSSVKNVTESNLYFEAAINAYESVALDYPYEGEGAYAKDSLTRGIGLAEKFGRDDVKARLVNKMMELYPDDPVALAYQRNSSYQVDSTLAGESIEFDDASRVIRLVSLDKPSQAAQAELFIEGKKVIIEKDKTQTLVHADRTVGNITLDSIQPERVELSAYCTEMNGDGEVISERRRYTLQLRQPSPDPICGLDVTLEKSDVEKVAKIRLIPSAVSTTGGFTETNLTVFIGIEKRAIQLTPDKVNEKIENLNKTIEKWENINEKLGKFVSGMKTACFATAAALTFKNFLTGLNGESLARQEVMRGENGWSTKCRDLVANKKYVTLDACYLGESDKIDSDVAKTSAAISAVNAKIQQIQSQHVSSSEIFGSSVDTEAVRLALADEIVKSYGATSINMGNKTWRYTNGTEIKDVAVNQLLTQDNVKNGLVSTDTLRSMYLNLELQKQGVSTVQQENVQSKLRNSASMINQNVIINSDFQKAKELESQGYPSAIYVGSATQRERYANVVPITEKIRADTGLVDPAITHVTVVNANPAAAAVGQESAKDFGGVYVLGLAGDTQKGIYNVAGVSKKNSTAPLAQNEISRFNEAYNIGSIRATDTLTYHNEIISSDRKVKYFETEPYRGLPAIVPFDTREGWYAATKQNLPGGLGAALSGGSGTGTYDASGRVVSYWLCNVGENGHIEFNTGYGDDLCQQINLNTGQPLYVFPGLDQMKATQLVNKAVSAIDDAARQYKQGSNYAVTVNGERFEVGTPEIGSLGTQCQDFMSPKDCHLLFNVCDPVVCPSSRCNLGGTYYVSNVVQTGIIGSIFMCLPNIREKIIIPVCLTGIHAGIEGFISIMRNYRDCLTENLETGEMVGICDQIYSIYLCEFFWNQVAPFINIIIPKLIEFAYGQGTRGGVEYLSVMSAWQNMENSVNYFTQSYAVNSFAAFQARNVQEIGTEVCKAFISVKAPTALKSLVEPDSPTQFHAWFDEKTFTTATVPATSQYKVFYHIFAGNDQGVYFTVYLKSPPESGYYASSPYVQVANGFIPRGEYASETKDFTAPQGYKELCVRINNEEKCGFKQVSTSFAVNYLRDSYVNDQLTQTDITSENECVAGTNDLRAMITPNIQQGVEETISPEIYNRGVVRICASRNPGIGTDPSRFVEVGYCDDQKIRCWLDKRSVENSLSPEAVGLKNETLQYLENVSLAALQSDGTIFSSDEADGYLRQLRSDVANFKTLRTADEKKTAGDQLLQQADFLFEKMYMNVHKAQVLFIKGEINEVLALEFKRIDDEARRALRQQAAAQAVSAGTTTTIQDIFQGKTPRQEGDRWIIDFGGSVGNYSINANNELEHYFGAPDNKWATGANWQSNGTDAEWRNSLRQELIEYKNSQIAGQSSAAQTDVSGTAEQKTCVLSQPRWVNSDGATLNAVSAGSKVIMRINAVNCEGKNVRFDIYESDTFFDDFYQSVSAQAGSGSVWVEWTATMISDGAGEPEFVFQGIVDSTIRSQKSAELSVTPPTQPSQTSQTSETGNGQTGAEQNVCSADNLTLCTTETLCTEVGKYWYEEKCNAQLPAPTYQITSFRYLSDGQPFNSEQGVSLGQDLKIEVEHTCNYASLLVRLNGAEVTKRDIYERNYLENLDTSAAGNYAASITCKDSNGVKKGEVRAVSVSVLGEVLPPI